MGLGPLSTSILPRIGVEDLSSRTAEDLEEWMRAKQIERSSARAMGALKRREKSAPKVKKPKVPKPRKHKNHCLCLAESQCCRCMGEKCLKPKKPKKSKLGTSATVGELTSSVESSAAMSVEKS